MAESLMDKLKAQGNRGAATAAATQAAAKTKNVTEIYTEAAKETFVITEAEIKKNPAYLIATDTKTSLEKRIQALVELKSYNKELTMEENEKNLEAFNQFLLYNENKILEATTKASDFTNDDAFSLFDDTVKKLQHNLEVFKGAVEPMVKAFGVMQKAREAGIPPHKLLKEVQDMKDNKKHLDEKKAEKEAALKAAVDARNALEAETAAITARLEKIEQDSNGAKAAKLAAEGTKKAEEDKFFLTRSKSTISDAAFDISAAEQTLRANESTAKTLAASAQATGEKLTRQGQAIAALETELKTIDTQASEISSKIDGDEDYAALSKLLEITGEEFKAKRGELVGSVKDTVDMSVKDFEKSMGRFESGGKEVGSIKNTIINVGGMLQMVAKADAKVRVGDKAFLEEQNAIVERIQTEKGADAVYDPTYIQAKEQVDRANAHVKESSILANRTGELVEKTTRQEGTYTGLMDMFRQKFMDSQRLRTNVAVEVSSKLLTTTKSLEMAIASEKASAVHDTLSEMSSAANQATSDIFNMLVTGKDAENKRMADTLKQAIDQMQAIDAVTKDLRAKEVEGLQTREAIRQVTDNVATLNDGLGSVSADAEREVQKAGLAKLGEDAVLKAAGAAPAPSAPKP